MPIESEAKRLESLWSGEFGDQYIDRNVGACFGRQPYWDTILKKYTSKRLLEVGCNTGQNLVWISQILSPRNVWGVDVNEKALQHVRKNIPGINACWSPARTLPFRDGYFDFVFTTGVLIHQPHDVLPLVMAEIVRCSSRYVLCGEYYSENVVEVTYRGQAGALFKRDYGRIYQEIFPELRLVENGFLPRSEGVWDDLTYLIFDKQNM